MVNSKSKANEAIQGAAANRGGALRIGTRLGVALFVAATLAACAVGPNYHQPKTQVAPTYGAAEPAVYTSEQAQVQFWKQFNADTLNKMVDDALHANHDLRIAVGRLAEARAARHQSLYDLGPTVTAAGGHVNQLSPEVQTGFAPISTSYFDVGFDATWALDLLGRVSRENASAKDQLQGAEASLLDAQVSV